MKISGSGMARADACPASTVLPRAQVRTQYSEHGHIVHQYLADVSTLGPNEALARVPDSHVRACAIIDLERIPSDPQAYAAEVAFAYNPLADTGRELGRGVNREYAALLNPGEIPGTADVVGLTDTAVVVLDYKTGWADLGPIRDNLQLRFYALAAARAYGRDRAIIGIIRVGEDGEPRWNRDELDVVDLDATAFAVRRIVARAEAAQTAVNEGRVPEMAMGDHCKQCPSLSFCPAQMSLVRQFAVAPASIEELVAEATDEQLAAAYERIVLLEGALDRAKSAVKERARQRPIPLSGGQVLGPVPREELLPEVALDVLARMYAPEVADAAKKVEVSVTKTSLEAALKRLVVGSGLKITHVTRDTLEAIRAAGGVHVRHEIRKHRPKAAIAATTQEAASRGET